MVVGLRMPGGEATSICDLYEYREYSEEYALPGLLPSLCQEMTTNEKVNFFPCE